MRMIPQYEEVSSPVTVLVGESGWWVSWSVWVSSNCQDDQSVTGDHQTGEAGVKVTTGGEVTGRWCSWHLVWVWSPAAAEMLDCQTVSQVTRRVRQMSPSSAERTLVVTWVWRGQENVFWTADDAVEIDDWKLSLVTETQPDYFSVLCDVSWVTGQLCISDYLTHVWEMVDPVSWQETEKSDNWRQVEMVTVGKSLTAPLLLLLVTMETLLVLRIEMT